MKFLIGLSAIILLLILLYLIGLIPFNLFIRKIEYRNTRFDFTPIPEIILTGILTAIAMTSLFLVIFLIIQLGNLITLI